MRFPSLSSQARWKLGWIQACTHMRFHNTYGHSGYSSWEFPNLTTPPTTAATATTIINDSDGSNYPFYGRCQEVAYAIGPQTRETVYRVCMNDNFEPHVTWEPPVMISPSCRANENLNPRAAKLTRILREQAFVTWLAAIDLNRNQLVVLRTYEWRMRVEIGVDVSRRPGQRAWLVGGDELLLQQPRLCSKNREIPTCVLYPPNANSAQQLVWYPSSNAGRPKSSVIIPSRVVVVSNPS